MGRLYQNWLKLGTNETHFHSLARNVVFTWLHEKLAVTITISGLLPFNPRRIVNKSPHNFERFFLLFVVEMITILAGLVIWMLRTFIVDYFLKLYCCRSCCCCFFIHSIIHLFIQIGLSASRTHADNYIYIIIVYVYSKSNVQIMITFYNSTSYEINWSNLNLRWAIAKLS